LHYFDFSGNLSITWHFNINQTKKHFMFFMQTV
jgi:hypothetical protein